MRKGKPSRIRKSEYPDARPGNGRRISGAEVRRAASLFRILSHPDRLRLACRLGDGRTTTQKALIDEFGWSQPTTARHLAALREAGLVVAERDGAEVRLRMGDEIGLHLMTAVCDWLHRPAPEPAATGAPLHVPTPAALASAGEG